jgi:hypothetical protein
MWRYSVDPNGVYMYPPDTRMAGHLCGGVLGNDQVASHGINMVEVWDGANTRSDAIFKLRAKIKDQKINFGTAIAEGNQTIKLVGTTAKRLFGAFKALKHGNLSGFMKECGIDAITPTHRKRWKFPRRRAKWAKQYGPSVQLMADRFLEFQFGVKPLLSDIDGAAHHLADMATANPSRFRFEADASAYVKNVDKEHGLQGNSNLVVHMHSKGKGRVGVRYVVWYSIVNRVAAEAAKNGLLDIASVAWEITPFSFLADYMFSIGKCIESCTATAGKEFISGTYTEFAYTDTTRYYDMVSSDQTDVYLYGISNREEIRYVDRYVLSEFPSVSVRDLVHVKNPFSVTHTLNMLALLTGTIRGLK